MKHILILLLLFTSINAIAQPATDLPGDPVFGMQKENTIKAYPNVTTGNFELRLRDDTPELHTIMIFDLMGKSVASLKSSSEIISFNLCHLPKGIYLVRLMNHNYVEPIRVMLTY